MSFQFDPTTGLLDTSQFPTDPGNETAARQQFMTLFNQLKDYLNNDNDAVKLGGVVAADYPKISADFVKSLATSGYQKLPGGLIIQWGRVLLNNPGSGTTYDATVTYPIAFPTGVATLFTNIFGVANADPITFNPQFTGGTKTNASLRVWNQAGSNPTAVDISWFAIGY